MTRSLVAPIAALWLGFAIGVSAARADDPTSNAPTQPNLVKQASAPIATIFQLRLQDAFTPDFAGLEGWGNSLSLAVTMPLPKYRLLPLPQLSVLTIPGAVTTPRGAADQGATHLGDVRFVDVALLDAGESVLFGVGPTFVFPTAGDLPTGQGRWQVGPAAVIAFAPKDWLIGVLAQNPISFAGGHDRPSANTLFLQPFVTYQLGEGWYLRSQPVLTFDWKTRKQYLPLDLAVGRVFKFERQNVSCFLEATRNLSPDQPAPRYVITVGVSVLFPGMWQ